MLFRLHLKANKVPGWEEAYLRYTLIVDVIEKGTVGRVIPESPSSQSVTTPLLERSLSVIGRNFDELLDQEMALLEDLEPCDDEASEKERRASICAKLLWIELDRIDTWTRDAVQDVKEAVENILRQSDAGTLIMSASSSALAAASAYQILHNSQQAGMEHALRDLYKTCFMLMQVSSLNYVGFRKLIKKARKQLGKATCDAANMPEREQIRSHAFFLEKSTVSAPEANQFFAAVQRIELIYSQKFTSGNQHRAKGILRSLRRPPAARSEIICMGMLLGAVLVLLVWSLWLLLLPDPAGSECPFCTEYLLDTVPAFRILLVPVVWLWFWAINCMIWEKAAINYIYIMDCDQRTALGSTKSFRLAGVACTILLSAFVLYVGDLKTARLYLVPPSFIPLFLLIATMFNLLGPPLNTGFSATRNYFLGCFARTALAPFFEVRFRDNFVADVLCSMVVILRDLAAMIFFYLQGGATGMPEPLDKKIGIVKLFFGPLITALPYWWRLMQCLRRWHDTPTGERMSRMHLINAGKYMVSLLSIVFASVGCGKGCYHFYFDEDKWTIGRIAWFTSVCLSTIYSYSWDIFMDWSLFEVVPKEEGGWRFGPFAKLRLRQNRGYEQRWFYIFAIFSNLIGRLMWTITLQPKVQSSKHSLFPQIVTTAAAVVEVMRRGQWALLRLENEHVSNAASYRSVADVPLMVELADRQLGRSNKLDQESKGPLKRLLAACTSIKTALLLLVTTALAAAGAYVIHAATRMGS